MKFEELKKSLMVKVDKNYMIKGKDLFLCDNAYRLIKESLKIEVSEFNEIKFNDLEVDFEDVVIALQSPAVFSDNKIVYVDISTKTIKIKSIDKLLSYLSKGDFYNVLIIKIGDNLDVLKQFDATKFTTVECDILPNDIAIKLLTNEARKLNKAINIDAVKLLLEYCNNDLQMCVNEIVKLANYATNEITVIEVNELVSKMLDYKIYELTEALARKNIDKVYLILNDLKHKKNGYQGILALIYSHFRRLLHMAITKLSTLEYADLFGIKEYAVKKSMEQVKLFKPKKLKEITDLCIDLEYKIKTSQITSVNAIDKLVLQIIE